MVREAGCPLGITIVGGSDTPIGILLVSKLQKELTAGKSNQVHPGDQLLHVNNQDLQGKPRNSHFNIKLFTITPISLGRLCM